MLYIIKMIENPLLQARANIKELHFLPFNPVDKRTAITYIDASGNWYRASKGAPEQVSVFPAKLSSTTMIQVAVFPSSNPWGFMDQILNMCIEKEEIKGKVHAIIDKFAERGLRSLAVALQV